MSDQILMFLNPDKVSDEELAAVRSRIFYARNVPIITAAGLSGGYVALNQFILKRALSIPFACALGVFGYFYTYTTTGTKYMSSFSTFKNGFDNPQKKKDETSHIIDSNHDVLVALNKRWLSYTYANNVRTDLTYDLNSHTLSLIHI